MLFLRGRQFARAPLMSFVLSRVDFSAVLIVIAAVSGGIWGADVLILAPRRRAMATAAGRAPTEIREPTAVDYARSFFPVAVAVLLVRAFIFEPYRIPSDSMMPTLRDGDFILVDKFSYGFRLPITNTKLVRTGEPQRGEVVVFHPPVDPSQVWIKRVVGLPGDHVVVNGDRLTINGQALPFRVTGTYSDGCYLHMQIASEQMGAHLHQALLCPVPLEITRDPPPSCPRSDARGYFCGGNPPPDAVVLTNSRGFDMTVPPGEYMMMGDNRDNSDDSRYWGFVSERELIGRATYIWFNWSSLRAGGPTWGRIGVKIR